MGNFDIVRLQTDDFRLFLRIQRTNDRLPHAWWANGKRIKENCLCFHFPFPSEMAAYCIYSIHRYWYVDKDIYIYFSAYIYIYLSIYPYIYMLLFQYIHIRKTENESLCSLVYKRWTVIDVCCFSKRAIYVHMQSTLPWCMVTYIGPVSAIVPLLFVFLFFENR
jgi:hypothetical protein